MLASAPGFLKTKPGLLVATALLAHALLHSSFFASAALLVASDETTYEQKRAVEAFHNLPVAAIAQQLNALLPLSTPIALSAKLFQKDFIRQRLTEYLYPRILDQRSSYVLGTSNGSFTVKGPHIVPLSTPIASAETLEVSFVAWLGALLGALGFGLALCSIFLRDNNWPSLWVIAAAAFLAAVIMACTIAQMPLSWTTLNALGMALLIVFGAKALREQAQRRRVREALREYAGYPENWLLVGLLAIFALGVAMHPVSLWDGRSVWLFLTKRIFMNGMLSMPDMLHADSGWSHTNYPLLVPAWLANMSALNGLYSERMASFGIPVLYGAIVSLLWVVSRQVLGRWEGAALTLSAFLIGEYSVAGGYVDAYLMMLLAIQLLALPIERFRGVAFVAAFACSPIKYEGLIFSGVLMLAFLVLHPEVRRRPLLQNLSALLLYLPAVGYRVFGLALDLPNDFQTAPAAGIEQSLVGRLAIAAREIPTLLTGDHTDYTRTQPLLWVGLIAVLLLCALLVLRRGDISARIALLVSLAYCVIAIAGLISMTLDMTMLVHVTLDRLLLHPALMLTAACFLALAPRAATSRAS